MKPPEPRRDRTGAQAPESPLPFGRWVARRVFATDLLFLAAEVVLANTIHAIQLMSAVMCCVPLTGNSDKTSSTDALFALQPLQPSARRADAILAHFPCTSSYAGRLLYAIRTGAIFDVRMRMRLCDCGCAAHMVAQLVTVVVVVTMPLCYQRVRHVLLPATVAVSLLGICASAAVAPPSLLRLGTASYFSSERGRVGAGIQAWKLVTFFRMPARHALAAGSLLWLLSVAAMLAIDHHTLSPDAPGRLGPVQLLSSLASMVVLPYCVLYGWERLQLRPAYARYLRSCGAQVDGSYEAPGLAGRHSGSKADGPAAGARAPGPGADARLSRQNDPWVRQGAVSPVSTSMTADSAACSSPRGAESPEPTRDAAGAAAAPALPLPAAPGVAAARLIEAGGRAESTVAADPLYRSTRPFYMFSLKVPVPFSDPGAAGLATRAALAALRSHNAAAAAAADGAGGWQGTGAAGPYAASGAAATDSAASAFTSAFVSRPLQLVSLAAVRGCVQLLLVLHAAWAAAGDGEPANQGRSAPPPVHHICIPRLGDGSDRDGVQAAVGSAAQLLVSAAFGEGGEGQAAHAQDLSCISAGAFTWPPVLSPAADAPSMSGTVMEDVAAEQLLVFMPARALVGLRTLRCVVAGRRQEVYLDAEAHLAPEEDDAEEEDDAGAGAEAEIMALMEGTGGATEAGHVEHMSTESQYVAVRLHIPPAALRNAGGCTLFLLPPAEAHAAVAAAAAGPAAGPGATIGGAAATVPLGHLPVPVLPPDAAGELLLLCNSVLAPTSQACMKQLLQAAGAGSSTAASVLTLRRTDRAQVASAGAALHTMGLMDALRDFVALLQLPHDSLALDPDSSSGGNGPRRLERRHPVAAWGEGSAPPPQQQHREPPLPSADDPSLFRTDPWVFSALLRLFASRRMEACLRERLRALGEAGAREVCGLGSDGSAGGDSGERSTGDGDSGYPWLQAAIARAMAGATEPSALSAVQPADVIQPHTPTRHSATGSTGVTGVNAPVCVGGGDSGTGGDHVASGERGSRAAPSAEQSAVNKEIESCKPSQAEDDLLPLQSVPSSAGLLWWLRTLLRGFAPPRLERDYQEARARQCASLDRLALGLMVVLRLFFATRSSHVHSRRRLGERGADPRVAPPVTDACAAPNAGDAWLELLALALFALPAAAALGMAMRTSGSARHRNTLFLSLGCLDFLVLLFIAWPVRWALTHGPCPLLPLPAAVPRSSRRFGLHWIYQGVSTPASLQLSPYIQARLSLIALARSFLSGIYLYGGRWGPAAAYALGSTLCGLLVSAAIDYVARRQFLLRLRVFGGSGGAQ